MPECGHLFPRYAKSTRWDEQNAHCQCHECNRTHEEHPEKYFSWYVEKYGKESLEQLRKRFNTISHFTKDDMDGMIEKYETDRCGYCEQGKDSDKTLSQSSFISSELEEGQEGTED